MGDHTNSTPAILSHIAPNRKSTGKQTDVYTSDVFSESQRRYGRAFHGETPQKRIQYLRTKRKYQDQAIVPSSQSPRYRENRSIEVQQPRGTRKAAIRVEIRRSEEDLREAKGRDGERYCSCKERAGERKSI